MWIPQVDRNKARQGKLISHISRLQMPPVTGSLQPVLLNPKLKMNLPRLKNSCYIYYNSQAIKLNMLFIVFLIINLIYVLIFQESMGRNVISHPVLPWRCSGCVLAQNPGVRFSYASSGRVHMHNSRMCRKGEIAVSCPFSFVTQC